MSKQKVAVVTDSTAYIPAELIEKYNIHVVPLILNWEGGSLLDGVDILPDAFYERLKTAGEIPTSSQPSPGYFADCFAKISETAESIVGIFISEHLSGTLDSAHAAAKTLPNIPLEIVDSRSTSMGLGLIALTAARAAERGNSHAEVAQVARDLVPRMRVLFVVDTLEYLHKGGRIGGARRLFGSMLSIKPVLHLKDGRIEPLASIRTKRKAIEHMVSAVEDEIRGQKHIRAAVIDAGTPHYADMVYTLVKQRTNPDELLQASLSPVIGTHVGPGTVGVAYYVES